MLHYSLPFGPPVAAHAPLRSVEARFVRVRIDYRVTPIAFDPAFYLRAANVADTIRFLCHLRAPEPAAAAISPIAALSHERPPLLAPLAGVL